MGLGVPASAIHGEATVYRLIRDPHVNKLTSTHTLHDHLSRHICKHTHTHTQTKLTQTNMWMQMKTSRHLHKHIVAIFLLKQWGLSHLFISRSSRWEWGRLISTINQQRFRMRLMTSIHTYSCAKKKKMEHITWRNHRDWRQLFTTGSAFSLF